MKDRCAALLALALLAGPMLAGCAAHADRSLTVYAAASLRDVLDALQDAYGPMTVSLAGSNALRVQIEQGAPADVFLSADPEQVEQLGASGHIDGKSVTFAHNHVVLVTPRKGSRVHNWRDLATPGVEIVGAVSAVPIQRYADELVTRLGALHQAPPDYVAAVERNIVSREDNVATVLARIELGEGDAAFVYSSNAGDSSVRSLPLPLVISTTYVGAAMAGGNLAAAHQFLEWLAGPQGSRILAQYGFTAP